MHMNTDELQWQRIKKYLLEHEECKGIHKMVWDDFAMLTSRKGVRYKISQIMIMEQVKNIVQRIINE